MALVTSIANNKGGCGKTTTAANLGAGLRLHGYDVLIIDLDGQMNLTSTFRVPTDDGRTTYDALSDPNANYIQPTRVKDREGKAGILDVLPATRDLSALDLALASEPDRLTRLEALIFRYRPKYDIVLIDTPPAMGVLTIGALYASDSVVVTLQPQFLAVSGLVALSRAIGSIEKNRNRKLPYKVLITQYDKRKGLHRLTAEQVEKNFTSFSVRIRENVALGEAPGAGSDIFAYSPKSNGAADYEALVQEYIANTHAKTTKR